MKILLALFLTLIVVPAAIIFGTRNDSDLRTFCWILYVYLWVGMFIAAGIRVIATDIFDIDVEQYVSRWSLPIIVEVVWGPITLAFLWFAQVIRLGYQAWSSERDESEVRRTSALVDRADRTLGWVYWRLLRRPSVLVGLLFGQALIVGFVLPVEIAGWVAIIGGGATFIGFLCIARRYRDCDNWSGRDRAQQHTRFTSQGVGCSTGEARAAALRRSTS